MIKVSDYIAQFFEAKGLQHIFSISGAGNVHLLKSIYENKSLIPIHPHQEQSGVLASLAYYRIANRLGVMITTSGGAATNAITGALDAWADSIPTIIISGQEKKEFVLKHKDLRMWGVQGFDICKTVSNITKYNALILEPSDIRYELEKAFHFALEGRPGPVWLDIPTDVQASAINEENLRSFSPVDSNLPSLQLDKISQLLAESKRPVFIFGNGIRLARAESLLPDLISKVEIPFLTSWNGLDVLSSTHELNYGREGTYGQRCANFVVQNADLIISIGSRLAIPQIGYESAEFARDAKKVVIDIDETELNKFDINLGFIPIQANAKHFLESALKSFYPKRKDSIAEWIAKCNQWRTDYPFVEPQNLHQSIDGFLNSYVFIDRLQQHFASDEIIATDMGTALTCTHQVLKIKDKQRIVTSTGLGEMGYGLPGAIGASLAANNQRVILINGDGSMMMNLQELQTIRHLNLPIKIFVYVNDGYLTIKHTQNNLFGNNFAGSGKATGVSCPDFEKVGAAFGLETFKIKSLEDLETQIDEILKSPEPVLCEVYIHPMQPLVPKTSFNLNPDGTLVSPPLEDLYPFLDRSELEDNMVIPVHEKSKKIKL